MNSNEVLAHLDLIAATASKNEKQALVTQGMAHPLFKRVCEYAYSPFKTYGIRQIPERKSSGLEAQFDDGVWSFLDKLIARTLTGNDARDWLQRYVDSLDAGSAELLVRVIRKDLRAGFSESTINKACKGLIPDFPYMRCSLPKDAKFDKWPWAKGVISQEKADGMFANVDHEEGGLVRITSRQGSPFPIEAFPFVEAEVKARITPGTQMHGEFLVKKAGEILPRALSNGIMNSVQQGGTFADDEEPVFMVWDQIPLSAVVTKGTYELPYAKRLRGIVGQLEAVPGSVIKLIPTRIVRSLAEAYAHAGELMRNGKEGTIVCHPDESWKDGTSKGKIKVKLEFEVDLEIEAIVPGRAGTKNEGRAGSFACRTSDGLLKVDVTVKNEALRDRVDANPEEFIGKIISVIANDLLDPSESNALHSLFLPRMAEDDYRRDKTVADSLERVEAIKQAAILGQALAKAA